MECQPNELVTCSDLQLQGEAAAAAVSIDFGTCRSGDDTTVEASQRLYQRMQVVLTATRLLFHCLKQIRCKLTWR